MKCFDSFSVFVCEMPCCVSEISAELREECRKVLSFNDEGLLTHGHSFISKNIICISFSWFKCACLHVYVCVHT